jgi:hypothetical protein
MNPRDRAARVSVPDTAESYCPSAKGGYQVAFGVAISDSRSRSAEEWIRATFEDAPRRWRWFLVFGWTAITCRLRPGRSPSRVLGWQVEQSTPNVAVIAVRAWVGLTSRIVTLVEADRVTLSSFVEFSGPTAPVARVVWAMTIPLHERVLPHLLTAAARRAAADA